MVKTACSIHSFFSHGKDGYHFSLRQCDPSTDAPKAEKELSAMNIYANRLMQRQNDFNIFLRGRKFVQQFVLHMHCKTESVSLVIKLASWI